MKISAAGVAWGDVLKRAGGLGPTVRPPFTPGYDLVGTVDKAAPDVFGLERGQRVAALPLFGGYAEYACLPATELVPVPDALNTEEALCLVLNYVVAYQLLHRAAQVQPGERVLIHSAAGGVGTALVQLARLANLEIYGTASKPKHDSLRAWGVTPIDYRSEDVAERLMQETGDGVDAVFDPFGGPVTRAAYGSLRKKGRIVVYGAHNIVSEGISKALLGRAAGFFLNLIPDGKSVLTYNVTMPKYSSPKWCRSDLEHLFDLLAKRDISPVIGKRFALHNVAEAHRMLESTSTTGKIIITNE